jgi:glycosyltransferase involved in cell wall biosynthesis
MKVAILSVYKDGTGYSHGALNTILACEAAGIDVVCRPITLTGPKGKAAFCVEHIEQRSLDRVDVVVQYALPHMFERKEGVRNVGMFTWETTHFQSSSWTEHCKLMDELWVHNAQTAQSVLDSGVDVPVFIVPIATDMRRFAKRPEKLTGFQDCVPRCIFYTVAEMSRRKNIAGLIRAYYLAFSDHENVMLAIKTHVPGKTAIQSQQEVTKMVEDIKQSIHIYSDPSRYPPVAILTGYWEDEMIDRLHVTGDVFVTASRGESWCIPAVDAMAWGNPLIVPNWGSFPEITVVDGSTSLSIYDHTWTPRARSSAGWMVNGQLTPCFGQMGLNDLYTGKELWFDPDLSIMAMSMSEAYDEWSAGALERQYAQNCRQLAARFDLPQVGAIIKRTLEV